MGNSLKNCTSYIKSYMLLKMQYVHQNCNLSWNFFWVYQCRIQVMHESTYIRVQWWSFMHESTYIRVQRWNFMHESTYIRVQWWNFMHESTYIRAVVEFHAWINIHQSAAVEFQIVNVQDTFFVVVLLMVISWDLFLRPILS